MSGQHTPGRLIVRGGYSIYTTGGTPVADTCTTNIETANDEANASRLAACWNACEGISTEQLERDPRSDLCLIALHAIRQRDDMLAALIAARRTLATALRSTAPDMFSSEKDVSEHLTIKRIDAAIQKATPPTTGATA